MPALMAVKYIIMNDFHNWNWKLQLTQLIQLIQLKLKIATDTTDSTDSAETEN